MPVETFHQNIYVRPDGRILLSPYNTIQAWLRRIPFVQRMVDFTRRISDPTITISIDSDHHQANVPDDELTIVSANLWHDWPRYRNLPKRLESLAQLVEEQGAQVVLLQEALRIPQLSASEWLAERLNMAHGYVRANGEERTIGFEEGPAILTNLPLCEVQALSLRSSAGPFVRRMALGARLEIGCCHIWVVSTHLGFLRRDNHRQMVRLRSWISELAGEGTAVIGGDFNAGEASSGISMAREHWQDTFRKIQPEGDGDTHLLRWPWGGVIRRQRLDYLFLKAGEHKWSVLDAKHLTTEPQLHSDHKAVLARLQHAPQSVK